DLKRVKIPLPPLEEQKRIAAILDKADAIRRSRKEAIRLTEELLRSTFLDMFGEPVTNPQGWDVLKLGSQVDELKYGTNAKCSEFHKKEDILVLRIPNIVEEKICWNDLKYAKLESSEVDKLLLKQGDLLFVRSNGNPDYIGRCALFEDKQQRAVYASYLIRARLKPSTKLYPAFIRDIVSFPTFRSRLTKEARTTAGNYNINTQGLKSLKLICPPKEKQKAYLNFGEKLSGRLKTEHKHLDRSTDLFNSLLQKAFRGEL
ncbi:MAG: restriction endonuclease subunit S, partial [Pleurocapsa sp. SU_5_0]|nr:restriction endonuclease subunit S [Pleurocapsa sp. SU_5_0]